MATYSAWLVILLVSYPPRLIVAECDPNRTPELHDEAKLHQDVLCAYNSNYRPVKDHKSTVTVKIRFALKYISFDSLEETFNLHSWVAMSWKDEFLTWTPSDYGGIKEIQVESHEIWTPRMALFNADASLYPSDSIYTTCLLDSDGTVTCVPHMVHSGICRTSLRRWPYDVQNCSFYFGSWMHTGQQVNFTFYNTRPIVLDDYQNGPGWKLLNVTNEFLPGAYTCCPNSSYPMLKYTFMMKREAGGPAAIVVIPSMVIVLLTLISQFLDIKDYTRLFLICFSLFGHFMFLTEIGYDIPKHSSDTPIILLFVRDSMLVTLTSIFVTLLLMSLRKRVVPAPTWVVSLNRVVNSGPGKYVVFTEFDPSESNDIKVLTGESVSDANIDEKARISADWLQFANVLNSFVFIVTFIVYFILVCVYIPKDD
ncbi:acetylcholine receptor subunit alpha-like [Zerene cesonia]|uniref:acetylcholine receptor subunit alpha-like n=1 Tax=Zerene cesonia TaxID=33412 RepID=UPI0018E526CE|nr:acetylcholine receptor subunit alpha-like [Zerene cesonia]